MDHWQLVRRLLKGAVRRRKILAAITVAGGVLLLCPVAFFMSKEPPRYRTTAVILMESRPDKVPVFQEFTPFRPLPVQLAILRSRSLAETVLENLPKSALNDLLERSYQMDYFSLFQTAYQRMRGIEPQVESPMRRALAELQRARMRFDFKTDGIVEITAEASKPQVAVDIVNTYIEVLLARTRSFNVDDARTSREFLERQLSDVKRSMTASEDALRNFNAGHGGVKVPDRSKSTVEQLSSTETALAEMETSRKMMQTRLQGLRDKAENQRRQPAGAGRVAGAPAPSVSPDIQRLRSQLTQLESTLLELRSKFTDEHPRVLLVKDRISEVQRQLGDAVKESTGPVQATAAVPPVERVNFGEQVVALETALHSLTAQEDALRKQAESLRQSLSGLSRSEQEYTRLARDVESNRHLHALLSDKLTGARMREQGEMKVVKVIDPPGLPQTSTSERRLLFLGLAFVAALAVGGVVPVGVEWIHRAVETEDDVEGLGLPVLAVLPRLRKRPPRFLSTAETHRLKQVDENFMFSEALRNLRVTIQLANRNGAPRSVLVASGFSGEGKSTLVVSLGMAFGEAGYRVVLADTDFQRPTLSRVLKLSPSAPGISDALETKGVIGESLLPAGDRVWVAPRGRSFQPAARGMLATTRLKTVVDEMTEHADIVICDSSPILLIPDNLFLASSVDGVILVARAGVTRCRDLARTKALLESAGARLMGVVINEMPSAALRRHYTNYYQTYVKKEVPARPV